MPYKSSKQDLPDVLMLEWALQVKNYKLTLDKCLCVGCQICSLACPKDAVFIGKQFKVVGEKALKSKIDVDLAKCNFCGVCDVTCLYGAVTVTINGVRNTALVSKESYPNFGRIFTLDSKECPKDCIECEAACPWHLIKVHRAGFDGKPITNVSELTFTEKRRVKINVDIQKEKCPTCKMCEIKCPSKTLKVKKIFEGKIVINTDKCPVGCHDCVDVCPVPNVLTVNNAGKVDVAKEVHCTYCGACKNVCSTDEALMIKRTKIANKRVRSGTWNKALEKLTSTQDEIKDFKAVTSLKKKNMIIKRLQDEINP
ncbi:MAG: 4Fe-4S dicluster domain-containing protein [Nitrososphaerota archaeon]|nr:4Fe-4S dicluster domain-containing protein [Nitrososphaerota archaeon]